MAQPPDYERQTDFVDISSDLGTPLDTEFNTIKDTTDAINANLVKIQRDDGALKNASVGIDQLKDEVTLAVNAGSDWLTATVYAANTAVYHSNIVYRCLIAHTSGTFATDLAAAKWKEIINFQQFMTASAADAATATTQAGIATTQAGLATADAVATAADRVQTGLDRVQTSADAVSTAADEAATDLDAIATAADRVQTALDRIATAADAVSTAADEAATDLDAIATAADKVSTNADVVLTHADVVLTHADVVQTGIDSAAAVSAAAQAAASAAGFSLKSSCRVATAAALTVTYANGAAGSGATLTNAGTQAAIAIDGVTLALTDRVLVKDQASAFQNGIYAVTVLGSGATNWVMVRATDYDTAAEVIEGTAAISEEGTVNVGRLFVMTHNGAITMGATAIDFTQLNAATATVLATARTINGVAFNGSANITVTAAADTLTGTSLTGTILGSSLTSVGTITTGVWNGTIITSGYGGTGNGYTKFTGPTTSEKTFTLPNADTTLAARTGSSAPLESFIIACSDETTAVTAGTGKASFRMPYAFTVTNVYLSATTAATGATLLTVDINESGTSIISTKLTLDASELTSTTAATPAVISDASIAADALMTIDFDSVGNTIAGAGVKVTIVGYKT